MTGVLERETGRADRRTRVPAPRRRRRPDADVAGALPLGPALCVAALSGLVLALAFPAPNVWILLFPGLAGQLWALRGRGFWTGALTGLVFGLAFWFVLIGWVTLFLGPLPLLALGTLEALFVGAGGGLIAVVHRRVPLVWPGRTGRLVVTPLLVAAAWTAREAIASTWPYGGFGWGRLALSQSTSPFAPLVAWFGFGGTGFLLAWLTAFALACVLEPRSPLARPDRVGGVLVRLLAVAVAAGLLLAIPPFRPTEAGTLRIAAVQPDTHAGYFDPQNSPSGNLAATMRATLPVTASSPRLIVWPEAASETDPFTDPAARAAITTTAVESGAHLLTGALTVRDGLAYNSSLLVTPGGAVTGVYDKVHPVPFGEYVPDRAFWTPFAPDLLKLIGRDFTPGTRSPVLDVDGVRVGVDICFDIVDDGLMLGAVADGAQVLVAQTNNADFGETEENEQQLAIARLRAIETGRAIVTDSTVASTAIIAPDGRTIAAAAPFRSAALVADVPLATGTTPAVAFGIGLNATTAVLGLLLPLALVLTTRRSGRPRSGPVSGSRRRARRSP